MQKENCLQKEELEKEITLRHTLQMQLESKNQLINSLTNECNHIIRGKNGGSQQNLAQQQGRSCSPAKQKFTKIQIQVN